MSFIYLPEKASQARKKEAENARKNRAEIIRAYSHGKVSRRDLIKWGIITSGGLLAPIHGLNPFVTSAYAMAAAAFPPAHRAARCSVSRHSRNPCRALTCCRATRSQLSIRRLRLNPTRRSRRCLIVWVAALVPLKAVLRGLYGRTSNSICFRLRWLFPPPWREPRSILFTIPALHRISIPALIPPRRSIHASIPIFRTRDRWLSGLTTARFLPSLCRCGTAAMLCFSG